MESYTTTKYFRLIEGIDIFRTHGGDACIESRQVEHTGLVEPAFGYSFSMRLSNISRVAQIRVMQIPCAKRKQLSETAYQRHA